LRLVFSRSRGIMTVQRLLNISACQGRQPFVPAGSGPVAGSRTCSHPIISTMDHCLLPALRRMLRLEPPRKNALFAGRAGAVMEGSGLEASFALGIDKRDSLDRRIRSDMARCARLGSF